MDKEDPKKKWLRENPEKRKEAARKYKAANKHKAIAYILNNYEWYMLNGARTRARNRNVPFDLTVGDIVIPTHCPYLGVELTRIQGAGRQDFNPSLDRIQPELGYVHGNIEVISDKANRMKNSASIKELQQFAKVIMERYPDG